MGVNMCGYICKYTPIEILECFDEEAFRLESNVSDFLHADVFMHPNMCAYSKAVLEEILGSNIKQLILINCCDSIKRLYDVLKSLNKFKFLYLLDIPRKIDKSSVNLFVKELEKFIKRYENFTGKNFDQQKLVKNSLKHIEPDRNERSNINIALLGARCKQSVVDLIKEQDVNISMNLTCTGTSRVFTEYDGTNDILSWYSQNLLNQFPCMRMFDLEQRYKTYNSIDNLDGIIYHTIKFCDNYSFDYAQLKKSIQKPILKIETDYTSRCDEQIKTRIEAYIEALKNRNIIYKEVNTKVYASEREYEFICVGIDSGSTSTKVVIIDEKKKMLSSSVVRTGASSIDSARSAFNEALDIAGISENHVDYVVSTGYGRVSIPFANLNVTEITCHGKGAYFVNNKVRTIIDIGGQDSKIIRINDMGEVIDFAMNDKCAAGTGRFLETMSRTLEIPLDKMGEVSEGFKESIFMTSICTVFAESEVVSLIAKNKNKADIIHGLNRSVSGKIISMLDRVGRKSSYMLSGGVAKNTGVVKSIEEILGESIYIYEKPEIVGALGAALVALENAKKV